jgi:hypothetical protein
MGVGGWWLAVGGGGLLVAVNWYGRHSQHGGQRLLWVFVAKFDFS